MDNQTKLKCPHCDAEYKIKWEDEELEPTTCPFCGAESLIEDDAVFDNEHEEEDAVFDNDQEDQDDWN